MDESNIYPIKKFQEDFKWRGDGTDSLLDVGCGNAEILMEKLILLIPPNYGRLVGIDVAEESVESARENYSSDKVKFHVFDMEKEFEEQEFPDFEPIDHVISFYCLYLVTNKEVAVRNLSKFLKPGGDMILTFFTSMPAYDALKALKTKNEKWASYLGESINQYRSIYHDSENPIGEFKGYLKANGFSDPVVDIKDKSYIYTGTEYLKKAFVTDPFGDNIPPEEMEQFFNELLEEMLANGFTALDDRNSPECRCKMPMKILKVYAKKDN